MNEQLSILPSSHGDDEDSSIEQKFLFDATRRSLLLDWLEFHMLRDPQFYFSPVVSIYYDTPSLSFYGEVCNGDYLKTKVRLRHYQKEIPAGQTNVRCFSEIKRKFGAHRHKRREPLTIAAHCLQGDLFSDPTIRGVPDGMPECRLLARGILSPVLVVEYERFRFVEPQSGARISLDAKICCSSANSVCFRGTAPVFLQTGVLEVKGASDSLPGCLRPMQRFLYKQSFSKYARCCELLLNPNS
jgi:hypothetical protein